MKTNSYSHYNPILKERAGALRKNMTKAEACLWKYVLRGKSLGYGFRRQRPVGKYIADFMCIPLKIIIEVDGITHSYETVAERDEIRQSELEKLGFLIIRYEDEEILNHIESVRSHLLSVIEKREQDLPLNPPTRRTAPKVDSAQS